MIASALLLLLGFIAPALGAIGWTQIPPRSDITLYTGINYPSNRRGHSMSAWGSQLVVFGGQTLTLLDAAKPYMGDPLE